MKLQKIFLALVIFFSSFSCAYAWWDNNWKSAMLLNITNKEDDFVFNMSINVTLDTQSLISQGLMKSDCSDIRIVYQNDLVTDVGIQNCNSINTFLYFKYNFTQKESKAFYIYFNNPSASSIFADYKKAYYALYEDFNSGSTGLFNDYQFVPNGGWIVSYDSTYGYVLKVRYSGSCSGDGYCKGSYVSVSKVASRNSRIEFDKYIVGSCGDFSGFGFTSDNGNYNYELKAYTSYLDMNNGVSNLRMTNISTSWSGTVTNLTSQQYYYSYALIRNKTHGMACKTGSCSDIYYFSNYKDFPSELYVLLWQGQHWSCLGFVDNVKVENIGLLGYSYVLGSVLGIDFDIYPPAASYGMQTKAICYLDYMHRNGTDVTSENNTYVTLPAGVWNYTCFNENASHSILYTVNKAMSNVSLSLSPPSPITYGVQSSAECSGDNPEAQAYLLRNGTIVGNETLVLPAGAWNYTCYVPETQNYTGASTQNIYVVNKASSSVSLVLLPSSPITYGTQTTASCSGNNPETSVILYRNGSNVGNHTIMLGAGTYNYTCHSSPTQNYTSAYQEVSYVVSKATNVASLYINGTLDQNRYLRWPNGVYAYGTCSNINNIQPKLYRNGTLISGTSETAQLSLGNWTYLVECDGNENYTSHSISRWAFASHIPINIIYPSESYYEFNYGEPKLLPLGWDVSSYLSSSCIYNAKPDIDNTSYSCYLNQSYQNTDVDRYYISGASNFMNGGDSIYVGGGGCYEKARVNLTFNANPKSFVGKINATDCYYNFTSNTPNVGGMTVYVSSNLGTINIPVPATNYIASFYDPACSYLGKNLTVWLTICVSNYNAYNFYFQRLNSKYDSQYIVYNVSTMGSKTLNVYAEESNTGNANHTSKIFFVDFINKFNVINNKGQHLPAKITFSNSTYNYTIEGTSPLYFYTSALPFGLATAYIESPNYIPQTQYYAFNSSTHQEFSANLINSGVYIKVLNEQSGAPTNWYKLAITNSSDRNEVNFNAMTSGSYTNYLTVGKGYPSTPFRAFLDDNLNTYEENPSQNFTYNFGYTNATFEIWYESSSGGTIEIRAWNNIYGRWDVLKSISTGATSKTVQYMYVNNKPDINATFGAYGDLFMTCEGYYCPLFEVKTTGNIKLYEIRLTYPYTYDINGFLSMNFTDFGMSTGRSMITATSPLLSGANNYGERTYYVNPSTEVATALNIYLYPMCHIQQFNILERVPGSDIPREIKRAMVTIYKEFEGNIYVVDQELTTDLGTAFLCVDTSNLYIFTVTADNYESFSSYAALFSNPSQAVNVYLNPSSVKDIYQSILKIKFFYRCLWKDYANNTYDENATYSAFGQYCPRSLPNNATEFTFYCAFESMNNISALNYAGMIVYKKELSNYPYNNLTMPVWNETELPFNMSSSEGYQLVYNVTTANFPSILHYTATDSGDYWMRCYYSFDWNVSVFGLNGRHYYITSVNVELPKKDTGFAGAGRNLKMSKESLMFMGLLLSMMVTGFFSYRFGVNSMAIFFLMWGLILTMLGGWGFNWQLGVFIVSIMLWLGLTIGRW